MSEALGTCAGFCECYKVPHLKRFCTGDNWRELPPASVAPSRSAAPEPTIDEAVKLIKKIEACEGIGAKLILLRNFVGKHASAAPPSEREAFEKWKRSTMSDWKEAQDAALAKEHVEGVGLRYKDPVVDCQWFTWQEARKLPRANCFICEAPLSGNGFIAWCDNGHVWELKTGQARAAVPQAAADGDDEATEARWQKRIYDLCREAVGPELADTIDGSGCDSGDALDVTVSEIKQAIGIVRGAAAVPAPGRETLEKAAEEIYDRFIENVAFTPSRIMEVIERHLRASAAVPQPASQRYHLKRYRNGQEMAQGARVTASSETEAIEKAKRLFPHECSSDEFRIVAGATAPPKEG